MRTGIPSTVDGIDSVRLAGGATHLFHCGFRLKAFWRRFEPDVPLTDSD